MFLNNKQSWNFLELFVSLSIDRTHLPTTKTAINFVGGFLF